MPERICRPQLHKAAAFAAGTLSEKFTFSAKLQPAAIFLFICSLFLRNCCNKLCYGRKNALPVNILEQAFSAKRSAHFIVKLTTEQGGTAAERTFPLSDASAADGLMFSGSSKSLSICTSPVTICASTLPASKP